MAPTASADKARIASFTTAWSIVNPLSFSPTKASEVTFTSSKVISDALNPSTVGKFCFSTPSEEASTMNKEIPFSST